MCFDAALVAAIRFAHQVEHIEPQALDFCAGRLKDIRVTRYCILSKGLTGLSCSCPIEGEWLYPVIFCHALRFVRLPSFINLFIVRRVFPFYDRL